MTWSEVTFGPVSNRNMRKKFFLLVPSADAEGGIDFPLIVTSNTSYDMFWYVESETPIGLTASGMSAP